MDLIKVLQDLHEELDNLNAAIASLERLEEVAKHKKTIKLPPEIESLRRPVRKRRKTRNDGS